MTPVQLLTNWIEEEKSLGAGNAQHAVLSTQGIETHAHGRVVAIREITQDWILLFTQKKTRKVQEIKNNKKVALTFWFERHCRETIIEGEAGFLSEQQNINYWNTYPHWAQVRFCSYAPTSGEVIESKDVLEKKRLKIEQDSKNIALPYSPDYCGIFIKPKRFVFYSYRVDELSDVWEYQTNDSGFVKKRLSP